MQHLHEDDLELYLLGRLPEQQAANLEWHVQVCQDCEAKLNEAVKFVRQVAEARRGGDDAASGEKRREVRVPTDESADLRPFEPLLSEQINVRVLNASKGGLMLQTGRFFEAGTLLQLRLKTAQVVGEVRYCFPVEEGFHVGIQIQDSQPLQTGASGSV